MTINILLGAGFSRNWGGWLATEVVDFLLTCQEIKSDPILKQIVWDHSAYGFEEGLEIVQNEAARDLASIEKLRRLNAMQDALSRMFQKMNQAFLDDVNFESHNSRTGTVREFLTWFDAIFTLNQDVLLEHHYVDNFDVSLEAPRRWNAVQIPGMRRLPAEEPFFSRSWARARWHPLSDDAYKVDQRAQPYFKLHGSSNWSTADGIPLLIIGGGKDREIQRHKVLGRYGAEFRNRVCVPGKLMVIGYGFRDQHINTVIADAVYKHGVELFVIDPAGRKLSQVLSSDVHPGASLAVHGYDLEEVFKRGLVGVSQRPLREIFGGFGPEYGKVKEFFQSTSK